MRRSRWRRGGGRFPFRWCGWIEGGSKVGGKGGREDRRGAKEYDGEGDGRGQGGMTTYHDECNANLTLRLFTVLFCPATLHSEATWHQRANHLFFQFHHDSLRIRATGAAWGSFAYSGESNGMGWDEISTGASPCTITDGRLRIRITCFLIGGGGGGKGHMLVMGCILTLLDFFGDVGGFTQGGGFVWSGFLYPSLWTYIRTYITQSNEETIELSCVVHLLSSYKLLFVARPRTIN